MKIPLVTCACITYNHEKFIKNTIEGFLMQKTNFPIEIIIHDDASTDQTTQIVKTFAKKYPDLISFILQKENQYSKVQGTIYHKFIYPIAKGKYIALCEGDDYWTDPYKLQKQVDFLEENMDYGLVHTEYDIEYERTSLIIHNYNKSLNNKFLEEKVFEKILSFEYPISPCTIFLRTELVQKYFLEDISRPNFQVGDTPLWMEISKHSKIKYLDESMAVRRILENSASHIKDNAKRLEFSKSMFAARFYFIKKYGCSPETLNKVKIKFNKIMLNYGVLLQDNDLAKKSIESLKINREKIYFDEYLALWRSKSIFLRYILYPLHRIIIFRMNK
jgi:glycosyltransferase involved in cell wall biosynthesis